MNRFTKLARLLKLSANDSEAWAAVLAEVNSEALPDYPELGVLTKSIEMAENIKQKATDAAPIANTMTQEEFSELKNMADSGALDSMLASLQKQSSLSSRSNNKISKRAGVMDVAKGALSFGKGLWHGVSRVLPFIGVYLMVSDLMENRANIESATNAIKNNFKDLGNGDDLFNPQYIAQLIEQYKADPVKMLEIVRLNKVAKFCHVNFLEEIFNAIMAVVEVINSLVVLASWGGVALIEGFVESLIAAIGFCAFAGNVSTEYFNVLSKGFVDNTESIKAIAFTNSNGDAESAQPIAGSSAITTGTGEESYEA